LELLRAILGWVPLSPMGLLAMLLLLGLLGIPILVIRLLGLPESPVVGWVFPCHGLALKDRILLSLSLFGVGLLAVTILLVLLAALWLRFRRQSPPPISHQWQAGVPFRTGYCLVLVRWVPLLKVTVAWDVPADSHVELVPTRGGLEEQVTMHTRACCTEVIRRITISDVFGLARIQFRRRQAQLMWIRPSPGQVRQVRVLDQYRAGDQLDHPQGKPEGDLIEMRRYAPGDPLKWVLWKVFARTGRLLVRSPERAFAPCTRSLTFLVAGPGDEPAAGIARAALDNGLLGSTFLFGADGNEGLAQQTAEAGDQVVRSVNARDQGGAGLGPALTAAETQGTSACLLLVPPQPGAWLERVTEVAGRHRGPFQAVLGIDGLENDRPRGFLRRLLLRAQPARGSKVSSVRKIAERLQQCGVGVTILDRASGAEVVLEPTETTAK
jgi:hypothetical protein